MVLFVCTGNTCRSPMAEALARSLPDMAPDMVFISRGVAAGDGPASDMAVRVMGEIYGIDIAAHVSRPVCEEDVRRAALILTMTASHKDIIAARFPFACDKLYTLGDARDISDPYMGDFDVYAACAADILAALRLINFKDLTL